MSTRTPDLYAVLGITPDASRDDVRAAYRRLARRYHPDVSTEPDAEERFKEVNAAFQVLQDPERRAAYDRGPEPPPAPRPAPGPGDGSWFAADEQDLQDIFADLFGPGARDRGVPFAARGADLEADLEVTLEEAARGGQRMLTMPDGRTVRVTIPEGSPDGRRIRLPGRGAPGLGEGPPGDLLLRIRLLPHPRFRAEGRDLSADLPVAPWEAALGAQVEVPTLTGTARVRVPPGSSSGRRLRLRGQGLPGPDGGGDLYLTLAVHVPAAGSDRERELWQELAQESEFDPRRAA